MHTIEKEHNTIPIPSYTFIESFKHFKEVMELAYSEGFTWGEDYSWKGCYSCIPGFVFFERSKELSVDEFPSITDDETEPISIINGVVIKHRKVIPKTEGIATEGCGDSVDNETVLSVLKDIRELLQNIKKD